ncbi:MAG: hypothetical protein H7Y13_13515 [Sphingobacteriaceae bacterium]|nr:hypothetical protein [Sphingobacteriaceae bacterium]
MESEILFVETQKFNKWLLMILLPVNGLFLLGVYTQVFNGLPFGDKPLSNTGLIITTCFVMLLSIVLFNSRLETQIRQDGIYVKFFPVHIKFRHFKWDAISKLYVRQYNPIAEFGGWGIRMGFWGKGKAYNASGNKGLQIEFSNQKRLLIGTQQLERLKEVLIAIKRYRE